MKSIKAMICLYIIAIFCLVISYCMVKAVLYDRGEAVVNLRGLFMYQTMIVSSLIVVLCIVMLFMSFFQKGNWSAKLSYGLLFVISTSAFLGAIYFQKHYSYSYNKERCSNCLRNLGEMFFSYYRDTQNWPDPNKWCDTLSHHEDSKNREMHYVSAHFICKGAGKGRSHYALNPKATANSSDDVVLLFDSNAGWNLNGGRELMNSNNHEGKGCNILFCGGKIKFVEESELNGLKWE